VVGASVVVPFAVVPLTDTIEEVPNPPPDMLQELTFTQEYVSVDDPGTTTAVGLALRVQEGLLPDGLQLEPGQPLESCTIMVDTSLALP
jgi:hypothetical protein